MTCGDTFKLDGTAGTKTCIAAACAKGTWWKEATTKCEKCTEGCGECKNGVTCDMCTDSSVYCQAGLRYNKDSTAADKCEACTVKNCE